MAAVSTLYINIYKVMPTYGQGQEANKKLFFADITWGVDTNTHSAGGIAITPKQLGVTAISAIDIFGSESSMYEGTTERDGVVRLDRTNSKLILMNKAGTDYTTDDVGAWKGRVWYIGTAEGA